MQDKRLLNNNKILNRKATVCINKEVEDGAMKHDMKKAYFTSTMNINKIVYSTILAIFKIIKLKIFLIIKQAF